MPRLKIGIEINRQEGPQLPLRGPVSRDRSCETLEGLGRGLPTWQFEPYFARARSKERPAPVDSSRAQRCGYRLSSEVLLRRAKKKEGAAAWIQKLDEFHSVVSFEDVPR